MDELFTDKDLGVIRIIRNVRAKNVIARRKLDQIQLTVPTRFTIDQIYDVFEKMKPRLHHLKSKPVFLFTPQTDFKTYTFRLHLEIRPIQNYYMNLKDGILSIVCPINTDFQDENVQDILRNLVEKAMRYDSKRFFPQKIESLAKEFRFKYAELKINKSKTRWGSCSYKRSINLSYFCMLLPEYLIDFVILHELCHTIEMNHGPEFWRLLDSVTDRRAKQFTKELKAYSMAW